MTPRMLQQTLTIISARKLPISASILVFLATHLLLRRTKKSHWLTAFLLGLVLWWVIPALNSLIKRLHKKGHPSVRLVHLTTNTLKDAEVVKEISPNHFPRSENNSPSVGLNCCMDATKWDGTATQPLGSMRSICKERIPRQG